MTHRMFVVPEQCPEITLSNYPNSREYVRIPGTYNTAGNVLVTAFRDLLALPGAADIMKAHGITYQISGVTEPQEKRPIDHAREMRDSQGSDGNWNYDNYNHGLYNGIEFVLSIVEGREPEFKNAPKIWISDIRDDLNKAFHSMVGSHDALLDEVE